MWRLAFNLFTKVGGIRTLGLVVACLAPLALLQCSQSRLEDLREKHRALEAEYAALQAGLELCREAAGLHDAVLMEHKRENVRITDNYNRLREEFLRALLPVKNLMEAPNEQNSQNPEGALPGQSFQDWCAQPVPPLVHGLLTDQDAARALPGTPGASPDGDRIHPSARP